MATIQNLSLAYRLARLQKVNSLFLTFGCLAEKLYAPAHDDIKMRHWIPVQEQHLPARAFAYVPTLEQRFFLMLGKPRKQRQRLCVFRHNYREHVHSCRKDSGR